MCVNTPRTSLFPVAAKGNACPGTFPCSAEPFGTVQHEYKKAKALKILSAVDGRWRNNTHPQIPAPAQTPIDKQALATAGRASRPLRPPRPTSNTRTSAHAYRSGGRHNCTRTLLHIPIQTHTSCAYKIRIINRHAASRIPMLNSMKREPSPCSTLWQSADGARGSKNHFG